MKKQRRIVDLSMPIVAGDARWTVERRKLRSHAAGHFSEVTWMGWPVHAFTHLDAARHFSPDGFSTDDITFDQVMGEAAVVRLPDVSANTPVTAEMVAEAGKHIRPGDIVLLSSGWDRQQSTSNIEYWTTAPFMTVEACRWLYAREIRSIGYDFPQDKCIRDLATGDREPAFEENTTHIELLLKGVVMFEYLRNLVELKRDRVEFIGLPLKLPDCDGAPVRAIALEEAV